MTAQRIETEAQAEQAQLHDELDVLEYEKALKTTMSTEAGRYVLWKIMDRSRMFLSCFTGNSRSFYLEGRRDLGLEFFNEIMAICPESFWEARVEQNARDLRSQLTEEADNG